MILNIIVYTFILLIIWIVIINDDIFLNKTYMGDIINNIKTDIKNKKTKKKVSPEVIADPDMRPLPFLTLKKIEKKIDGKKNKNYDKLMFCKNKADKNIILKLNKYKDRLGVYTWLKKCMNSSKYLDPRLKTRWNNGIKLIKYLISIEKNEVKKNQLKNALDILNQIKPNSFEQYFRIVPLKVGNYEYKPSNLFLLSDPLNQKEIKILNRILHGNEKNKELYIKQYPFMGRAIILTWNKPGEGNLLEKSIKYLDKYTGGTALDAINLGDDVLKGVNTSIDDFLDGNPSEGLKDFFKESGKGALKIPEDTLSLMKDLKTLRHNAGDKAIDAIMPKGEVREAIKKMAYIGPDVLLSGPEAGANISKATIELLIHGDPKSAGKYMKAAGMVFVDTGKEIVDTGKEVYGGVKDFFGGIF